MSPEAFRRAAGVSRETFERLRAYEAALRTWRDRINLVSRASLRDVWRRHFLDSIQLARWADPARRSIDLGSGAGFPGMVVAIALPGAPVSLGAGASPAPVAGVAPGAPAPADGAAPVVLAESDARKCAFLREVRRLTGAPAEIAEGRAEDLAPGGFDLVMARGLAALPRLLAHAERLLAPGGSCVFLKGAAVADELTDAGAVWNMDLERHPSVSDPRGVVLRIRNLRRV